MALFNYPYPSLDWDYQGFDFAYPPANMSQQIADDMYADGVRFVGRYLYGDQYPAGKGISATEAQYYLNAGIKIYLYYEVVTTDALQGYAKGVQNGTIANNLASAMGIPIGTQIYCCCDTGVTDAQANGVVMDYLYGFASMMPDYNVGIYGGQNVMDACYNTYPTLYRIQAGAWGYQEFSPINIRQWFLGTNNQAMRDGKIRISNITIASNGYAYWKGHNVDLTSADTLDNMWGDPSPTPPTPPSPPPVPPEPQPDDNKMPIWMYLRQY